MSPELCVVQSRMSVNPSESYAEEHVVQAVKRLLRSVWKNGGGDRFMGANPVSVERKDLSSIRENDVLISLKSDGVRYMLVLINVDGDPFAVMVDRRMRMYEVSVWADMSYFDGTIIDGELVWEHGFAVPLLTFVSFDVMMKESRVCYENLYSDRLSLLH